MWKQDQNCIHEYECRFGFSNERIKLYLEMCLENIILSRLCTFTSLSSVALLDSRWELGKIPKLHLPLLLCKDAPQPFSPSSSLPNRKIPQTGCDLRGSLSQDRKWIIVWLQRFHNRGYKGGPQKQYNTWKQPNYRPVCIARCQCVTVCVVVKCAIKAEVQTYKMAEWKAAPWGKGWKKPWDSFMKWPNCSHIFRMLHL